LHILFQAQVEKCRAMIDKLEQAEESDSKAATLQTLEAKMLALQTQLRTLRGQAAERSAAAANEGGGQHGGSTGSYPPHAGPGGYHGYQGGRGRGYGRFAPPSGRGYYTGRYPSTGRGRGRGRGAYFGNQAYVAGRGRGGGAQESYSSSAESGEAGYDQATGGEEGYGEQGEQWQSSEGLESSEMES
jgi:hypothetical protein